MGHKNVEQQLEDEWQAAEAALNAARALPGGPERFAALRRAGQLRYEVDKRRQVVERKPPK
jgi:hypothetical protein